jgi:lysophospholipase L1-like esterase
MTAASGGGASPVVPGLAGRVVLALLSLAAVLGAGEAYLRWHHASRVTEMLAGRAGTDLLTRATGDDRVYELRPSTRLANSLGFHDIERQLAKPSGTYRIAAVGDSVTMQDGLPMEELYVSVLQQLLNARRPEARVEVLNFGVTGYGPRQELALLRMRILDFAPDLVLWQFHDNDGADPMRGNADGSLVAYYSRPRSRLLWWVSRRLTAWDRSLFVRREGLQQVRPELVEQLYHWDEVGELFREVARLTADRGIPVFLFLYPSWPNDTRWQRYSDRGLEIHRRLTERFRSLGFAVLDLLPLLQQEDPSSLRLSSTDPWHPSARGHRWIAERLAAWLLAEGPPPLGPR